jgi:tRNA G46 methylase TrmB
LITPRFVHALTQKLVPGRSLHVATDDPEYARAIDDVLGRARELRNIHAPDRYRHERSSQTASRPSTRSSDG